MGAPTLRFSKHMLCPRTPNFSPTLYFISTDASHPAIATLSPLRSLAFPLSLTPRRSSDRLSPVNSLPPSNPTDSSEEIHGLSVPESWLVPSMALEESEWLRVTLHKWLDDEYCPEETNIEISKVAATSFYMSLLENTTDLGEILLKMARALESISYQDSFHGAFSSANAAVDLISRRIEQD